MIKPLHWFDKHIYYTYEKHRSKSSASYTTATMADIRRGSCVRFRIKKILQKGSPLKREPFLFVVTNDLCRSVSR